MISKPGWSESTWQPLNYTFLTLHPTLIEFGLLPRNHHFKYVVWIILMEPLAQPAVNWNSTLRLFSFSNILIGLPAFFLLFTWQTWTKCFVLFDREMNAVTVRTYHILFNRWNWHVSTIKIYCDRDKCHRWSENAN